VFYDFLLFIFYPIGSGDWLIFVVNAMMKA